MTIVIGYSAGNCEYMTDCDRSANWKFGIETERTAQRQCNSKLPNWANYYVIINLPHCNFGNVAQDGSACKSASKSEQSIFVGWLLIDKWRGEFKCL